MEAEEERQVPVNNNQVRVEPNPFHSSTVICYTLPSMGRVECRVFDATGRVVATLFSGQQDKGSYRLAWNREDHNGRRVNHGVYFVRIAAQGLQVQSKLVVL